jgi:hypothetical protein
MEMVGVVGVFMIRMNQKRWLSKILKVSHKVEET